MVETGVDPRQTRADIGSFVIAKKSIRPAEQLTCDPRDL